MKKSLLLFCLFLCPILTFAQTQPPASPTQEPVWTKNDKFFPTKWFRKNALIKTPWFGSVVIITTSPDQKTQQQLVLTKQNDVFKIKESIAYTQNGIGFCDGDSKKTCEPKDSIQNFEYIKTEIIPHLDFLPENIVKAINDIIPINKDSQVWKPLTGAKGFTATIKEGEATLTFKLEERGKQIYFFAQDPKIEFHAFTNQGNSEAKSWIQPLNYRTSVEILGSLAKALVAKTPTPSDLPPSFRHAYERAKILSERSYSQTDKLPKIK